MTSVILRVAICLTFSWPTEDYNLKTLAVGEQKRKQQRNAFLLYFCFFFFFFYIFIRYFLHLNFKCYPTSPLYTSPALLPYLLTPTSWPWRSPVLGHIKFARPRGLKEFILVFNLFICLGLQNLIQHMLGTNSCVTEP